MGTARPSLLVAASALLLLFVAVPVARAEEGRPYVGYLLGYQSYQGDVTGSGPLLGLMGGYATSSPLSLELRAGYGASRTYRLGASVAYVFFPRGLFRPFLQAGWEFQTVMMNVTSDEDQVRLRGNGPEVGLGFDYFTHAQSSIGFSVIQRFIRYERPGDPRVLRDLDSRGTLVGLRWNVYYK